MISIAYILIFCNTKPLSVWRRSSQQPEIKISDFPQMVHEIYLTEIIALDNLQI